MRWAFGLHLGLAGWLAGWPLQLVWWTPSPLSHSIITFLLQADSFLCALPLPLHTAPPTPHHAHGSLHTTHTTQKERRQGVRVLQAEKAGRRNLVVVVGVWCRTPLQGPTTLSPFLCLVLPLCCPSGGGGGSTCPSCLPSPPSPTFLPATASFGWSEDGPCLPSLACLAFLLFYLPSPSPCLIAFLPLCLAFPASAQPPIPISAGMGDIWAGWREVEDGIILPISSCTPACHHLPLHCLPA